MTTRTDDRWPTWLADSYRPGEAGCPPIEAFHRSALGELEPEEEARLRRHAASCPACSAELELAETFEAPPARLAERRADVDAIVAALEADPPHRRRPAAVAAGPGSAGEPRRPAVVLPFRRLAASPAWRLAAAAVLALGIGLAAHQLSRTAPPPLPQPVTGGVTRGTAVTGLTPAGELAEAPHELRWDPVAGAAAYRLTLRTVDDTVLWQERLASPPAALSSVIPLSSAVRYTWEVEAVDADGRVLARSERQSFRILPAPEPDG